MTLVEQFVDWYLTEHPVEAALLGADGHDHTLGDFSEAGFTARERAAEQWLRRLTEPAPGSHDPADPADSRRPGEAGASGAQESPDDEIDRELVASYLRGVIAESRWPEWRRDPAPYVNTVFGSMFTPFQQRLKPEPELVEAAISRLADVPAVLAACRANLDPDLAADLLVARGLGQARTARRFLTVTLPAEIRDPGLRERFARAAEPAAAAFDELAGFLEGFQARGDWRMGEKLYSELLREREMLGYGAAELHDMGREAWADIDARMREVAARLGPSDWRAAMETLMDDHPPTLEAMRAEYEAETLRARDFVKDRGLVTFPDGEDCQVLPSPEFQRPILAVANYLAPPPLTASRAGVFFVPFTPDGFTEEQVRQRLRTNSRAQMASISVHEAYPGHHWHLAWMAANPRRARQIFTTPYFVEGWALYVEKVMHEEGYFDTPQTELAHLDCRIFRAARIVVDTALHCGEMTIEEAETFMATKASLSPGTAAGEVNRYCAWPTQAPSYLTGALEIERIRSDFNGDLRTFHDEIAGSGGLPLGLARKAVIR